MKSIIFFLALIMFSDSANAQVGRIGADGSADYAAQAQELKRQRSSAPTYEQLAPAKPIYYNSAVNTSQQEAAEILTAEDKSQINDNKKRRKNSSHLRSFGNQNEARNLMIVEAVAHYKLQDEKLAEQMEFLQNNTEYQRKLQQIMDNLSNNKMRNNKNKQVINILNDTGNRLYNLLAN